MPLGTFISGLLGKETAGVIASTGKVLDDLITSTEEKEAAKLEIEKVFNLHSEKIQELILEGDKAELADKASARDREIAIANSDKAPLINKIILPILASFVTLGFFGILLFMMFHSVPIANSAVLFTMLGSLGTAWITIVGYYFGSSLGSSKKSEELKDLKK